MRHTWNTWTHPSIATILATFAAHFEDNLVRNWILSIPTRRFENTSNPVTLVMIVVVHVATGTLLDQNRAVIVHLLDYDMWRCLR